MRLGIRIFHFLKNEPLIETIFTLFLTLQIAPDFAWGKANSLLIHLGKNQKIFNRYSLGDKESLNLHNGYSNSIRNIKILNYPSGKQIMSIKELPKNQTAKLNFSRGTYIIRFHIINSRGINVSQEFQLKVNSQVML